jgi:hypothetical protein
MATRSEPEAEEQRAPRLTAFEVAATLAARRVAIDVPELGLAPTGVEARAVPADAAFSDIDAMALCLLIDPIDAGAGDGLDPSRRLGAIAADPALVDALIEAQTVGQVKGPGLAPRMPTRIDAALTQPFLRDLLAQLGGVLDGSDAARPRPGRLRVGQYLAGPSALSSLITAPEMVRLDLDLSLGEGARQSRVTLCLPAADPAPEEAAPDDAAWTEELHRAVLAAPVRLNAVLGGLTLPLSTLMSLEPGQVIPLSDAALSRITLRGGAAREPRASRAGATLSGRLGQLGGMRAIKLSTAGGRPLPEPTQPADLPAPDPDPALAKPADLALD